MTLLLDSALKATPVLALAWMATALLRRASADLRHRIWLTSIFAVAILPAALRFLPTALPSMRILAAAGSPAITRTAPGGHLNMWVMMLWVAGMLVVLARLATGSIALAKLTAFSTRVQTPLTWGIINPAIILPCYMREWTDEQLEGVLRHERVHIARHDWFWQTLTRIVAAVFWFHPLMWIADAALRREAELATDDRVILEGAVSIDYAEQLLSVARRIHAPAPAAAVAMARRPNLETRVANILDSTRNRSRAGIYSRAAVALVAAALLIPLTALSQDDTVHRIGEPGLTGPRVLNKIEPQYTEDARDAKIQGTVALQMVIDEEGKAQDIHVVRSLDEGLDQSGMAAVSQWQFSPAMKNGRPVCVAATIEINFHLQ